MEKFKFPFSVNSLLTRSRISRSRKTSSNVTNEANSIYFARDSAELPRTWHENLLAIRNVDIDKETDSSRLTSKAFAARPFDAQPILSREHDCRLMSFIKSILSLQNSPKTASKINTKVYCSITTLQSLQAVSLIELSPTKLRLIDANSVDFRLNFSQGGALKEQ